MKRQIYLVGIGMGTKDTLTPEARHIIQHSDVLIGAQRMLEVTNCSAVKYAAYMPQDIAEFLEEHEEYTSPCILLSGDVGFYSGAKGLMENLQEFDVRLIPGISSISCFGARIGVSWQDMSYVSCHGRTDNIIYRIVHEQYTFALLGGDSDIKTIAGKLKEYGIENITFYIGENLSYPDEKIYCLSQEEIEHYNFQSLAVLVAYNPYPRKKYYSEIKDDCFIRGNVPMTKSEVRTLSIAKMALQKDSCIYDIGAGTGSVSVQAAMQYPDAAVYAIEKNQEGISLIAENKRKFAADNIIIIEGTAPECMRELPAPTHVFIGGSSGNMAGIMEMVFAKNPDVTIVINAIALETVAEVMGILRERELEPEEILQVSVAKAKHIGAYHMMTGQNPVTIIVVRGKKC